MSITYVNRLPSWKRGHPPASVASSTDASTFSSEGDCKETDRCCCKHQQCTAHIIHPFDYGHCNLHLHAINHCDCDARVKDGSEKSSSGSGSGPTCCNIIKTPCFELIPEEACVEQIWYGWCKSYRPVSVAVIHHPIRHECLADDLNEEDDSKPPIPTQVGPTTTPADTCTVTVTSVPDTPAPITIWRSESPTGKSPGGKATKKKKKKEKDKEEETTDEKTKLKKKPKKGKLTKKKSPVKSECSPPDLTRSLSPRDLARMSESSPESREDLESEESYTDRGQGEPSSEDMVQSSSPRKKDRNGAQAKKTGGKTIQARKVNKRKSPPASTPTLS
ncbi:protein PROCA1 isoform X5 [Ochotona curzoniae]|uniref:protein PROCA1 isoform X5 n=1 Tax=Ochotona curzoniae TaxID=130825 RepID=UPI001B3463D0|nr:protein PROCA1 isoform X5 [Ochotona curzoniae]